MGVCASLLSCLQVARACNREGSKQGPQPAASYQHLRGDAGAGAFPGASAVLPAASAALPATSAALPADPFAAQQAAGGSGGVQACPASATRAAARAVSGAETHGCNNRGAQEVRATGVPAYAPAAESAEASGAGSKGTHTLSDRQKKPTRPPSWQRRKMAKQRGMGELQQLQQQQEQEQQPQQQEQEQGWVQELGLLQQAREERLRPQPGAGVPALDAEMTDEPATQVRAGRGGQGEQGKVSRREMGRAR